MPVYFYWEYSRCYAADGWYDMHEEERVNDVVLELTWQEAFPVSIKQQPLHSVRHLCGCLEVCHTEDIKCKCSRCLTEIREERYND